MPLCFQKSLDEQRGYVLKFSGELDKVSREDFHKIFAEHAQIKWIDFTRGAKEVRPAVHCGKDFCDSITLELELLCACVKMFPALNRPENHPAGQR